MLRGLIPLVLTCLYVVAYASPYEAGQAVGQVDSERLNEISGLVASRRYPEVFWVHNDSGDNPYVYAINRQGKLLGTFQVVGARAVDWEDIAWARGETADILYLADIGDNAARRQEIAIYSIAEPNVTLGQGASVVKTEPATVHRYSYPDGPYDAETLLVDPVNQDLYIVTKRQLYARLYRAPLTGKKDAVKGLEFVTILPVGFVVGGDVAADGSAVVLRTLTQAWVWPRSKNTPFKLCFSGPSQRVTLLPEPQGEAICFSRESYGIYTVSEGKFPNLYFYVNN